MSNVICRAGVVQGTPALFDLSECVRITIQWLEQARDAGCDFVLFPESFIPGYPRGLQFDARVGSRSAASREQWLVYHENSLEVGGPAYREISKAIQRLQIACALGVTERDGGTLYCTLLYFDETGGLLGRHRKLKPTGLERYIWGEGSANDLVAVTTPAGKTGGLICWENYMPLARMAMYELGVETYLAPTADARESWQATMQHVAREGRCFVLSANQFVRKSHYPDKWQEEIAGEPDVMSNGGSVILGPSGEILAGPLWGQEGLLTAELDMGDLTKSKLEFDVTGHYSRKDVFRFEVIKQGTHNTR